MEYTKIPKEYKEIYYKKFTYHRNNFKVKWAKDDPTVFAYYMLGWKLRIYQSYILDIMLGKVPGVARQKKLSIGKARQIGISTTFAIFALWAAYYNRFPTNEGMTKVYLVSRSDDQAKELLQKIYSFIRVGDDHMYKFAKTTKSFFSDSLTEPKNTTELTFNNGRGIHSSVKSVPPTEAIIGKTASILLIDEAAKLNHPDPDKFFEEDAEPLVATTQGYMIVNSTPNGIGGFFYRLYDPFEKKDKHEFYRIGFHWTINEDVPEYKEFVLSKKSRMEKDGEFSKFQQEFEVKFVSSESNFFDSKKVVECVNENLSLLDNCSDRGVLGLDFGIVNCNTVITIVTKNEKDKIRLIYQYEYPLDSDDNVIVGDVIDLMKRFNISNIVADDCPQGNSIIQDMENKGLPVIRFNFRSLKNTTYYSFRRAMYRGDIEYPQLDKLMEEMKELQEVKLKINVSIQKPPKGSDDLIDSLVMATYPYLEVEESFGSAAVGADGIGVKDKGWRYDVEWEAIRIAQKRQERLLKGTKKL